VCVHLHVYTYIQNIYNIYTTYIYNIYTTYIQHIYNIYTTYMYIYKIYKTYIFIQHIYLYNIYIYTTYIQHIYIQHIYILYNICEFLPICVYGMYGCHIHPLKLWCSHFQKPRWKSPEIWEKIPSAFAQSGLDWFIKIINCPSEFRTIRNPASFFHVS
jgi:hypothetical protein